MITKDVIKEIIKHIENVTIIEYPECDYICDDVYREAPMLYQYYQHKILTEGLKQGDIEQLQDITLCLK